MFCLQPCPIYYSMSESVYGKIFLDPGYVNTAAK